MANNIQESINNAIDIIVGRRIDALATDKTVIGIIDSVIDSVQGIYKIKYDGGYFKAESQSGAIFPKGMSVYVQIPQNDMTKKKFIIGRASDLRESERADIVISNLNNYAIVGNSVITPQNESIGEGIRSYHDETNEDDIVHPITHRAKLIYSSDESLDTHYHLNLDALQLYKENATALMVQAEFRTSFDTVQRYSGTGLYGIGLNLSFENSDYQYGSTQGEIFNYFASSIQANIERYDDVTKKEINTKISMKDIDNEIQNALKDKTFDQLTKVDGILDKYIAYGNSLITAYAAAAPATYIQEEDAIMQSYLAMLSDLKNLTNSLTEIQTIYTQWIETSAGKPSKQVSYVLDSNDMTGNPFTFTSWSTQYAIFNIDFEHFQSIDSILFYKQGFNWSTEKEEERGEDIFIRNLKIYALQPISAINGDYRLEMQMPDGLIFETLNSTEKLTIIAKVTKAYYEDLSNNAVYYWFKKNPAVTSVTHSLYNQYGGIGWEYIGGPEKKGTSNTILVYGNENTAYKNKYKCVCLVDETILLKDEFILYNNAANADIEINSNLGQNFSFDAGSPILTCLLRLKNDSEYKEYINNKYQYIWSMTINNVTTSFSPNYLSSLESIIWDESSGTYIKKVESSPISSIAEAMQGPVEGDIFNIIQNVQFYKGEELITSFDELIHATRIKYPISNLATESVIIFTCSVIEQREDKNINLGEASIDLQNQGHPQINSYRLILENGDQVFQYDEYGNPPNSPKLKSPQEIKPIIPHLLNPAGIEVSNKNYKVQWTLPIENTLIISSSTLGQNPFDNDRISLDSNSQCAFTIVESYNEDKLNNQILCRVTLNGEVIQATTDFYFGKVGSNGTNGTDMVAKIVPVQDKQILNTQPIILYRYNNGNNVVFNTGTINSSTVFLANSDSSKNRIFKAKLYQKNEEIAENNFSVRWNIAGNPQTTSNTFSRYMRLASALSGSTWNSSLRWDETFNKPTEDADYIKYQPIYTLRAQITYQDKDYYAFYSLPVIYYNSTTIPAYNRIAINKSTLLKEVVYNADGRNPIYNHNQGVEIINIPKDAIISWYAYGGENGDESTVDFKLLKERNGKKKDAVTHIISTSLADSQNFIYVLPNDDYNGSHTNNRIIAVISRDNTEIATITVPLHMHLNTFGLTSLNAWDGNTVTIDEDGGYVMAPQVGAGEKDNNNRFTGILMGKTETYTGSSENEVETGLFGYAHGIQSIFLDSNTGNAYFGLPDGKILDKTGNIPIPKDGDNYNEGRVELIPGGISKVGGWRLGHSSLYYTANTNGTFNGSIGSKYTDSAASHHNKDIPHNLQGILLSAVPAYISIKGRVLNSGDISDSSDTQIVEGDSLEIQLDPLNPTMFAIYRHHNNARQLISGINTKGQLVANRVEQAPASSANTRSSLGIESINAFNSNTGGYVGLNLEAGKMSGIDTLPFFRIFIDKNNVASSTAAVHLSGGQFGNINGSNDTRDDYTRPINIHGASINLYAKDNDSTTTNHDLTQKVKLNLDKNQFYAGDSDTSYINLYAANTSKNKLHTVGSLDIETTTSTTGYGHINIYAGPNNTRSYLTLNNNGEISLLGRTNLNEYAHNGNINLYAQNSGVTKSQLILTNSGNNSKLESVGQFNLTTLGNSLNLSANTELITKAGSNIGIYGGGTNGTSSNHGIYMPVATVNSNAFFRVVRPLDITSTMGMNIQSGAAINIKTNGTQSNNIINIENTSYNPSANGSNIINVSTAVGGFAIQKNVQSTSKRKGNSVLTLNDESGKVTGFVAPYGYFTSNYDDNSHSVYAKNAFLTDFGTTSSADGAKGYAFGKTCKIESNSYSGGGQTFQKTITGNNVYDLILNAMNQAFAYARDAYKEASVATTWINNNASNLATKTDVASKLDASTFTSFKEEYDGHVHFLGIANKVGGFDTNPGGEDNHTHHYADMYVDINNTEGGRAVSEGPH